MSFDIENRDEDRLMQRIAPLFYNNLANRKRTGEDSAKFDRFVSTYQATTPGYERRASFNTVELILTHPKDFDPKSKDIICLMYRYHVDNMFLYSKGNIRSNFNKKEMEQISDVLVSHHGVIEQMQEIYDIEMKFNYGTQFKPEQYNPKLMDMLRLETASNMLVNMKCFNTFDKKGGDEKALHDLHKLGSSTIHAVEKVMSETRDAILDSMNFKRKNSTNHSTFPDTLAL